MRECEFPIGHVLIHNFAKDQATPIACTKEGKADDTAKLNHDMTVTHRENLDHTKRADDMKP